MFGVFFFRDFFFFFNFTLLRDSCRCLSTSRRAGRLRAPLHSVSGRTGATRRRFEPHSHLHVFTGGRLHRLGTAAQKDTTHGNERGMR